MIPPRNQPLFAIRREGKWFAGSGCWVDEIKRASIYPRRSVIHKVRIDIGMQCEIIEVMPAEVAGAEPEIVK